jgi:adenylate cyclase class 2
MQTEIEAKFLNVDHSTIRKKLKKVGAVRIQSVRLMRRKNFDFKDLSLEKEKSGWVRVRDEGDKVTLSYKQLNHRGVDGTKEITVDVDNFEKTCNFLESINLKEQSYQETKRESWKLGAVEIELDEWPWINPFIEIEAPTQAKLFATIKKLGLEPANALHGSVEIAYQAEYDVTEAEVDHWPSILFGNIPAWLIKRKIT